MEEVIFAEEMGMVKGVGWKNHLKWKEYCEYKFVGRSEQILT